MKRFKLIAASAAVLAFASSSYADVTLRFTGSTAFRAAAHNAMRDLLTYGSGQGYAYTGTSLSGTNNSIFKGTIAGQPALGVVTIKCTWSGSTGGIQTLTTGATVGYLPDSTTVSAGGTANAPATLSDVAVPDCTMMDTQQATTPFQSPELTEQVVGVLPFVFVAGRGAPAGITNMTAQLARQLFTSGFLSASAWTGSAADAPVTLNPVTGDITTNATGTTVYSAGRDNASGTRTLALTESGIGGNSRVVQLFSQASIRVTPRVGSATILDVLSADRSSLSSNMVGKPVTGTGIPGGTTVSTIAGNGSTITISAASTAPGTQIDAGIGQALSAGTSTGVYLTRDTGNSGQSSGGTLADQLRVDVSNIADPFGNQTNNSYSAKACFIGYLGLSDADRAVNGTGSSVGAAGARYLSYEGVSCMGGVAASITVASQGANVTTLTVPASSTTGIIAGQLVSGNGIAPGTTVVSTTSTTIVLSAATTNSTTLTNNVVKATQFLPAAVRNGSYTFWAYQRLGFLSLDTNKTTVKDAFFNQLTGSSTDLGAVSGIPDDFTMQFQRSIDGGQVSSKF